jgi:hypothetical protein
MSSPRKTKTPPFGGASTLGKDLRQGLPLQVDVSARVSHRRVQACVTEPLTGCGEVNPRFEKMDRRCVAQRI